MPDPFLFVGHAIASTNQLEREAMRRYKRGHRHEQKRKNHHISANIHITRRGEPHIPMIVDGYIGSDVDSANGQGEIQEGNHCAYHIDGQATKMLVGDVAFHIGFGGVKEP